MRATTHAASAADLSTPSTDLQAEAYAINIAIELGYDIKASNGCWQATQHGAVIGEYGSRTAAIAAIIEQSRPAPLFPHDAPTPPAPAQPITKEALGAYLRHAAVLIADSAPATAEELMRLARQAEHDLGSILSPRLDHIIALARAGADLSTVTITDLHDAQQRAAALAAASAGDHVQMWHYDRIKWLLHTEVSRRTGDRQAQTPRPSMYSPSDLSPTAVRRHRDQARRRASRV